MIKLNNIDHFTLDETFLCGQCFRWEKEADGTFYGVAGSNAAKIYYHDENNIYLESSNGDLVYWSKYLNFSCDYNEAEKFLSSSLNVSETSRNLYMHRNTLLYRLDKIEKATGLNIRMFPDAVTFRILTVLYKLLKK